MNIHIRCVSRVPFRRLIRGILLAFPAMAFAQPQQAEGAKRPELVLATQGQTEYQIVLPSTFVSPQIETGLRESARMLQAAFAANEVIIPVVLENERDPERPGLFLGATEFARKAGVDLAALKGYDYLQKAVGPNLILAGNDAVSEAKYSTPNLSKRFGKDRLATVKAVADFARKFVGTRFLYPDMEGAFANEAKVDFRTSPGIEFLPTPRIAVPADLDNRWKAPLWYNFSSRELYSNSIYKLASNRFAPFNQQWSCHSHEEAVPPEKYFESHPEYFALLGGKRQKTAVPQYCISNPDFQELIYQYLSGLMDNGHDTVYLGHSDGFRPCECEECLKLYGTGDDWTEKLWIFNRKMAGRLNKSHPDKTVVLTAYTVTERSAPKTFKSFPPNTMIMMCGTNEKDFAKWEGIKIPKGISAYIYSWTPSYTSRYAPLVTPTSVERQMKRLHAHDVQGIFSDGSPWESLGLEGPTAYVFARMWDDPENLNGASLSREFIEAAFGRAATPMTRFYDGLYQGISLYADYFGTRLEGWGRGGINNGFQMLSLLYPPQLLQEMNENLTQAEELAKNEKVKARLALVRRQFKWLRLTVDVVHLGNAYAVATENKAILTALLDAIDERNAFIASMYGEKGMRPTKIHPAWNAILFPPPGHSAKHLQLAYARYREDFNTSALNWDTAAMRNVPANGTLRTPVWRTATPTGIDAMIWQDAAPLLLAPLPDSTAKLADPIARVLLGPDALHVLIESPLPADDEPKEDAVEVFLAARPGTEVFHRFRVNLKGERSEAATGLIEDQMHILYGREDPEWSGPWKSEVKRQPKAGRWLALLKIPYSTLGVDLPAMDSYWRANFGRSLETSGGPSGQWVWSGATRVDDHAALGVLDFPSLSEQEKVRAERQAAGMDTPPEEWAALPNPLPAKAWGSWRIHLDPTDKGLRESWQSPEYSDDDWKEIRVPAWYAETEVGAYNGIAWYRVPFQVPADWKGRELHILFAAVDKEAWVYLNGHLLREHTEQSEDRKVEDLYDRPFEAVAPASDVVFGGKNVLAVRVRNSFAGGGISRPVLIHAAENAGPSAPR